VSSQGVGGEGGGKEGQRGRMKGGREGRREGGDGPGRRRPSSRVCGRWHQSPTRHEREQRGRAISALIESCLLPPSFPPSRSPSLPPCLEDLVECRSKVPRVDEIAPAPPGGRGQEPRQGAREGGREGYGNSVLGVRRKAKQTRSCGQRGSPSFHFPQKRATPPLPLSLPPAPPLTSRPGSFPCPTWRPKFAGPARRMWRPGECGETPTRLSRGRERGRKRRE